MAKTAFKPLRMLKVYKFSPDNLTTEALAELPGCVLDLAGTAKAYTKRQALAMHIDSLDLPGDMDRGEFLNKLCACTEDENSDLYSPEFVTVMREDYPIKRFVVGWLVNYYAENELGSFRGTQEEKRVLARRFMKAHGIYDNRFSRTITVPGKPTKEGLKKALRKALDWKKYDALCAEYETALRKGLDEREAEANPVEVQMSLF